MNIPGVRADIAKLEQETMRLAREAEGTRRRERAWTPVIAAGAALACVSGLAALVRTLTSLLH